MGDEWRGLRLPTRRRPKLSEEVIRMGLTKHGAGEILREPEDNAKTAKKNWTEDDAKALAKENESDDDE
jgi:hypothetical protein